jgi:hypothetical protein
MADASGDTAWITRVLGDLSRPQDDQPAAEGIHVESCSLAIAS